MSLISWPADCARRRPPPRSCASNLKLAAAVVAGILLPLGVETYGRAIFEALALARRQPKPLDPGGGRCAVGSGGGPTSPSIRRRGTSRHLCRAVMRRLFVLVRARRRWLVREFRRAQDVQHRSGQGRGWNARGPRVGHLRGCVRGAQRTPAPHHMARARWTLVTLQTLPLQPCIATFDELTLPEEFRRRADSPEGMESRSPLRDTDSGRLRRRAASESRARRPAWLPRLVRPLRNRTKLCLRASHEVYAL